MLINNKIIISILLSTTFLYGCFGDKEEITSSNMIVESNSDITDSSIMESNTSEVIPSYVITFHITEDETQVVEVKENEKIELFIPERNGFTFLGWFYENNTEFDENTLISSDLELFAKWELQFGGLV